MDERRPQKVRHEGRGLRKHKRKHPYLTRFSPAFPCCWTPLGNPHRPRHDSFPSQSSRNKLFCRILAVRARSRNTPTPSGSPRTHITPVKSVNYICKNPKPERPHSSPHEPSPSAPPPPVRSPPPGGARYLRLPLPSDPERLP